MKNNANETKVLHGSEMFNNIWGIQIKKQAKIQPHKLLIYHECNTPTQSQNLLLFTSGVCMREAFFSGIKWRYILEAKEISFEGQG